MQQSAIEKSQLYKKLSENQELQTCVLDIRQNCILLGEKVQTLIPGFTDHSVKHMDALWDIADQVFTKQEIDLFTFSEAFVLGSSFYFHDLGMAIASTEEGILELKSQARYKMLLEKFLTKNKLSAEIAEQMALRITARDLHAQYSKAFCKEEIKGLKKYIIEKEEIRRLWADFIGDVAESHHWTMALLDEKLGSRGKIPSPIKDEIDLGLVACALRIIDYAHINLDRANHIERLLRSEVDNESLLHWMAQENITGPLRHNSKLKYATYKDIENVEAWWLFYNMASGLDREIITVSEYLNNRVSSKDRFSLEGVQEVKTPRSFATLVRTKGFEPIDIRFRPDSIERLIEILGGRTLYGNDSFAPLRELIQNARDAILLRSKIELEISNTDFKGAMKVSVDNSFNPPKISVKDNGIGMTSSVIENYLLGIASDYWNSDDFSTDFPNVNTNGFSPIGRFGIGFLSVFMIGDIVDVITERKSKSRIELNLKGLGKHGSLVHKAATGNYGTTVSVSISKQEYKIYSNLEIAVKARAPMLTFPVHIQTPNNQSVIQPYWWKSCTQNELFNFINNWDTQSNSERQFDFTELRYLSYGFVEEKDFEKVDRLNKWPTIQPEIVDDHYRLMAIPNFRKNNPLFTWNRS